MILSVSRRTDIPNYYSEWFLNRMKEGYLYVKNPMNPHQISHIELTPETVDCIVFWTKNPANMLDRLEELLDYKYYFQFTLTGYGKDIEPNIPNKREELIQIFQRLSDKIGSEKVIWRYDPILISQRYTIEYHLQAFTEIAAKLKGYTQKVVISFVDLYAKTQRNTNGLDIRTMNESDIKVLAKKLVKIAEENNLVIETCAEQIDLQEIGIKHGSCIDKELIERILGCKLQGEKDKYQRLECGCLESIEVGTYNTCNNGCKYCYANENDEVVRASRKRYDVNSPLLCGNIGVDDKITVRKMASLKQQQLSLFD